VESAAAGEASSCIIITNQAMRADADVDSGITP
jgi:hypothetical protein